MNKIRNIKRKLIAGLFAFIALFHFKNNDEALSLKKITTALATPFAIFSGCKTEPDGPPENEAPTANAGATQNVQLADDLVVTLNGSGADTDGTIASYAWTVTELPPGAAVPVFDDPAKQNPKVSGFDKAGDYTFQLVVTDNKGEVSEPSTVTVKVNPAVIVPPDPPEINEIAVTGATPVGGKYRYTDTLTLGGNAEEAGVTYAWTYETVPAGKTLTFDQSAASPAVGGFEKDVRYIFKLTITDEATELVSDEKSVEIVIAGNVAPTSSASAPAQVTLSAAPITLSGTGSDSDGNIEDYAWVCTSFVPHSEVAPGNAKTADQITTAITNTADCDGTVVLKQAGTYKFKLNVTDNDGAVTGSDEVTVTVSPYQVTADVNVAAVPFVVGSELKLKVDGGVNNNYSFAGSTDDFATDDLEGITYTLSSANPTVDLSAYSNGNVPSNLYNNGDYPTITQTFHYNGQVIGSRKVVVDMTGVFTHLYAYKPTVFDNEWYDTDFEDIQAVPTTTLTNLKKNIADIN